MKPFISIIIPALNEEEYLPKLLRDFSIQTEKDFEVIVVDGNSDDLTTKKALTFKDKFPLQIIVAKKRKLAHQRNVGAKKAKGKYVVFLDADMRIGKNFIKKLKGHALDKKYLLLLPVHVPENSEYQDQVLFNVAGFFVEMSHFTEKPFTYGPAAMIHKDLFHHVGGYDTTLYISEDQEIIQRIRKSGVHAKIIPDVKVSFSMRRFVSEGRLTVLRKYLIGVTHMLSNKKVTKKDLSYDMGGQAHYIYKKHENPKLKKVFKEYFDKLSKILEE